jgi:hypothetical protein
MGNEGFLSRWSRRKLATESERKAEEASAPAAAGMPASAALPATAAPVTSPPGTATQEDAAGDGPPPLTLDDVARLTPESDFTPFVARGVDEAVKRSALKKLFADPHFNIMDGLDTYIDDYSKFEPIPAAMLASLNHAKALLNPLSQLEQPLMRLLEDDPAPPEEAAQEDAAAHAASHKEDHEPAAGDPNGTTQEKPEDDDRPIQSM